MKKVAFTLTTLLAGTSAVFAQSAPGSGSDDQSRTIAELKGMVNNLQQQVDEMKAQNNNDWLTEQRAEEIKGLVQEVLADADTRASLLEGGVMAGYDKGFFIGSGDGNWMLRIGGQLQVRYVYNYRNDPPSSVPDQDRQGFELRRAKLIMKGNVVDPSWQFDVQIAADRNTGTVIAEDAVWIRKDFGDGWKTTFGQMKAPYLLEEIISSQRMFAIERSLFNTFFTAGTVQGVNLSHEHERLRFTAMYYDGVNSGNASNTNKGWQAEDTEWGAIGGRVEFLAAGEWKQFADYDAWRGEENAVMIGAAANYQNAEYGTGNNLPSPDFNNNEVANLGLTLDATAKFGGFGLSGAFAYRMLDPNLGDSLEQYGFYVQGGVFLDETLEVYARYEWANADMSNVDDLSVVTIGVSKFFDRHNLKWQTDIGYGINSVNTVFANSGAGWQPDSPDEDGQVVIRSQFQLLF